MRPGKGSSTAQFVACSRALGTLAPTVPGFGDPLAERFLNSRFRKKVARRQKALENGRNKSPYDFWFQGMGVFNQFRKVILDRAITRALPLEQLVSLGAGLDGRAWSLPGLDKTTVFEVDHPDTQQWKRKQAIGLNPIAKDVRFIEMSFSNDGLAQRLSTAGFDQKKTTFWLWEGVTMYLTPNDNVKTLTSIADIWSPGSGLALTYMVKKDGRVPHSWFLALLGEPILSAYTMDELGQTTHSAGWITESNTGIEDWKAMLTPDLYLTEKAVGMQWNERVWIGCKGTEVGG